MLKQMATNREDLSRNQDMLHEHIAIFKELYCKFRELFVSRSDLLDHLNQVIITNLIELLDTT